MDAMIISVSEQHEKDQSQRDEREAADEATCILLGAERPIEPGEIALRHRYAFNGPTDVSDDSAHIARSVTVC
jgi:16S rRNA U1498 N3-methylase RsmE